MARRYYFLLSSLPRLPELGEAPPMALQAFYGLVAQAPATLAMIEAVLLEQDLLSREAALAGELERPEPVVLTAEQVSGTEPLPEFLTAESPRPRRIAADATWEAYYRYSRRLATNDSISLRLISSACLHISSLLESEKRSSITPPFPFFFPA